MKNPATRTNLSQAVTDRLRSMIEAGELRAGDRLPTEQGLMEMFGVGRNTVREGIQGLVAMGLVDVRPRVGATVRAVSGAVAANALAISSLLETPALTDLYEFRRVIEVEIASRAADRGTNEQIETIRHELARYRFAVENRLPTYQEDIQFHRAIANATNNVVYCRLLDAVTDLLTKARRETQHVPGAEKRALNEHEAIYAAIQAGDEERARRAMTDHIESAIWALEEARLRAQQGSTDGSPVGPGDEGRSGPS